MTDVPEADTNPSGRRLWQDERGRVWKVRSGGDEIGRKRVETLLSRPGVEVAVWEVPTLTWHAKSDSKHRAWEAVADLHQNDDNIVVRATEWTSGEDRVLLFMVFC